MRVAHVGIATCEIGTLRSRKRQGRVLPLSHCLTSFYVRSEMEDERSRDWKVV